MTNEQSNQLQGHPLYDRISVLMADFDQKSAIEQAAILDQLEALDDPTTSPEISPDSQAIEQARNRLKAATDVNGEQALGVLEDLRRILGVTQ